MNGKFTLDDLLVNIVREVIREELKPLIENQAAGDIRTREEPEIMDADIPYLSIKEAARYARLAVPTIRLYIRQRKIPMHKVGRRVIIKRKDLERFLEQTRQSGNGLEG